MWKNALLGMAAATIITAATAQERPSFEPGRSSDVRPDPSGTGRTCPPATTSSEVVLPDGTRARLNTADCVETQPRKQ